MLRGGKVCVCACVCCMLVLVCVCVCKCTCVRGCMHGWVGVRVCWGACVHVPLAPWLELCTPLDPPLPACLQVSIISLDNDEALVSNHARQLLINLLYSVSARQLEACQERDGGRGGGPGGADPDCPQVRGARGRSAHR